MGSFSFAINNAIYSIFFTAGENNNGNFRKPPFVTSEKLLNETICVVGFGYVGTPLAEAFL